MPTYDRKDCAPMGYVEGFPARPVAPSDHDRIVALEARVHELEQRLLALEQRVGYLNRPHEYIGPLWLTV